LTTRSRKAINLRKPEECFSVVIVEGVSVARGEVFEAME
jgi:hypothetical protein